MGTKVKNTEQPSDKTSQWDIDTAQVKTSRQQTNDTTGDELIQEKKSKLAQWDAVT